MKVLITGASGVLGQNLVRYLIDKQFDDLVLLDIAENEFINKLGYPFYPVDITQKNIGDEIFEGVDVIVHCASAAPSYSEERIRSIVIDGTRNMLQAALENSIDRFVYISSTAVYGIPDKVPVYEDSELQDYHDPYNQSKIIAEQICSEYRINGMCVPILRPRTFLGPGRMGTFAMLNDWASNGRNFPLLGSGKNKYQFLDVEDLCQAIYLCMTKPDEIANDTFNIGAKEYDSIKSDYQSVLDEAGFGKKIKMLPAAPALFLLRILDRFKIIPLYKRLYEKIVIDYFVSIEKAEKVLGYQPEYSNKATFVRSYRWYLDNKDSFKGISGNANSVPWKQGVLGLVRVFF